MRISSLLAGFALIVFAFALPGCGGSTAKPPKNAGAEKHAEHDHKAPHGGTLIELGKEEYHGELVHDEAGHKVTIYVLDSSAAKDEPITEKEVTINLVIEGKPEQFKLPAAAQEKDGAGKSSRFELTDEKLSKGLDAKDNKAKLNLTINGTQFVGEIAAHDHDHDHK